MAEQLQAEAPQLAPNITHEILRLKLIAITDELSLNFRQTAQIAEINEERDYSTALMDRSGAVIAIDNASQLGATSSTAHAIIRHFRFDMREGDVVVSNDLAFGGTRAVDLTFLTPLFEANAIVGYIAVRARVPDLGGMQVGGISPDATEQFGEGVPLTPLKLMREGRPVRDIMSTLLLNSRLPDVLKLTVDAIIACMEIGRRRISGLVNRYGPDEFRASLDYAQSYTERRIRSHVATWPDGVFRGDAELDHNGAGGPAVTVRVAAQVSGNQLTLDFGGSDAQTPGFINASLSCTAGAAAFAVISLLCDDIPANEGVLRAIKVVCDAGRVTSATPTAATGWSAVHCGNEIVRATARALHHLVSIRFGDLTVPETLLWARPRSDRAAKISLASWVVPGSSAAKGQDGWGRPAISSRSILPSIEEWEVSKGVRIRSLEYAPDSCATGRWRGAPAVEAILQMPHGLLYTMSRQGMRITARGVQGGRPGPRSAATVISTVGSEAELPVVAFEQELSGQVLRLRSSSGGGYGDPFSRDPEAVAVDVLDGLLSTAAAESHYGVLFTKDGPSVDWAATAARRARQEN